MSKLPVIHAGRATAALKRLGFVVDRQKGAHVIMVHPDHPDRLVTVPDHGGKDLKRGTLRAIIRDAGVTVEQFVEALN